MTSLNKLLSVASSLPIFTPSRGHTYFTPAVKILSSSFNSQATQTSKEGTPMPESQGSAASSKAPLTSGKTSTADLRDASLLAESFALSLRYGNEYMDENPLVGEPGSFILTKSREVPSQSQIQSQTSNSTASTKPSAPPTPAPLKTDIPPGPFRKSSKGGEKSPITPGFKDKKGRKKSKVAVSTPK